MAEGDSHADPFFAVAAATQGVTEAAVAARPEHVGHEATGASFAPEATATAGTPGLADAALVSVPLAPPVVTNAPRDSDLILLRLQVIDGNGIERRMDVRFEHAATVRHLKAQQFAAEVARGQRPRIVFLGRVLADNESLAQLPGGATLQCYLPAVVNEQTSANGLDPFGSTSETPPPPPPCTKSHDFAFHSVAVLALAIAWGVYFTNPEVLDNFSKFALRFFSVAWGVVCFADTLNHAKCAAAPPPPANEGQGTLSPAASEPAVASNLAADSPQQAQSVTQQSSSAKPATEDTRNRTADTDEPFTLTLVKAPGDVVGLDVDWSDRRTLVITKVKEGGLISKWNSANLYQQVKRGDSVVEINGVRGDSKGLLNAVKGSSTLVMHIIPGKYRRRG